MHDLLIIGGGPAGLACGIYGVRAGLDLAIIERGIPGGQMQNTLHIDNYPGFTGVLGPDLSQQMYDHARALGVTWIQETVSQCLLTGATKEIVTEQNRYNTRAVVVATGGQPRFLQVPGEKEFRGRGVSYCATCDGAFFKGKQVVVVGGGDSAIKEALYLASITDSVLVVHRRDELRALPVFQEQAFATENVKFAWSSVVQEIMGDQTVTHVTIRNLKDDTIQRIAADGVFVYVGFTANTSILAAPQILNPQGFVVVNSDMATEIEGVYAAGDVRQTNLRQIITAANDGAVAATSAYHYLKHK